MVANCKLDKSSHFLNQSLKGISNAVAFEVWQTHKLCLEC